MRAMLKLELKRILKKIKQYDVIVIARHISPDPDAIASQISLRDAIKLTEGRMVLDAQSIDGITSPDAFYYKLGFRKLFQKENEIIENYIKQGKTIPPDSFSDQMYLPRDNIKQLLGYKRSS